MKAININDVFSVRILSLYFINAAARVLEVQQHRSRTKLTPRELNETNVTIRCAADETAVGRIHPSRASHVYYIEHDMVRVVSAVLCTRTICYTNRLSRLFFNKF